ncbi:hypothetical protein Tco_0951720 [Tanacetum coccineum]|uniref:Uncharacterized protein n=1 Tax=Tanacetum coccineum TaxID=301880 RepID=A0ABQ5DUZ7_9ASTR
MLNSDLLIPVGYETSKYGYAPSRPADLMDGPLIARIRGRSRRYMRLAHVRRIHSNDREGVPMAKAGRLCILKKEMAPLLQVVTSYSSPELMELTGATGKMPRMAVSMGITGLSMNLLQMHEQDEIYKDKNEKSFAILEVQRVHNHFVTDRQMAQIAGSIGAKGLSSRLVSIFFRKIGCPPTMMVVLSLSMAKLCVFPDLPLSMDSAECAHKPEDPELRLGPPETPLERGKASLPSLNELPPILYEQQIQIPGRNLINVELEKNEMASIINQLPKNELQGVLGEDSIRKPLNEFNAEQQGQLKDLAINHFAVKNEIIAQMKYLYPGDEWEFTKVIREKFFQGRQKGREFDLEHLQKMLSALKERGKSSSCAAREWEGGSLLIGPAWILVGARPTEVFLRNHIRMQFSAHPSERGTALAELSLLDSRRVQGQPALTRLLALLNAPPRSKLSRIRQMQKWGSRKWLKKSEEESSWTTVYTRRKKQIEQRPPLSVRSSRSSSPTKPTTPCSSLSALAGESLRMNVGLDRGIKTSSTGRERIGESVTEMKAGVGQTVHVAKVKPIVRVRVLVQDRTVWDLLLRALEASNQPGRSRSEVYYLTKGRVSGIRGFAIPVSLRRCSRPKSHVMLSETPRTTRIEDAPLVRKHNGLACGANGDLRLQEGKRQPPSSKDFFEGGALLYSFARETST